MKNEILKHLRYTKISYKYRMLSMSMYRGDYISGILIQLIYMFTELLFLSVTIGRIGHLGKWEYGIILAAYGFFELVSGLFWMMFSNVTLVPEGLAFDGDMDKYLLKPYSVLFQLTLGSIQPQYIPNTILGFLIFMRGVSKMQLQIGATFCLRFLFALVFSVILMVAIFITFSSIGFWLNDKFEIKSPISQLMQLARYPKNIYSRPVAFIITWIIPLAFVGFLPVLYIFSHQAYKSIYSFLPVVSLVWFVVSLFVWRRGLKRYTSVS